MSFAAFKHQSICRIEEDDRSGIPRSSLASWGSRISASKLGRIQLRMAMRMQCAQSEGKELLYRKLVRTACNARGSSPIDLERSSLNLYEGDILAEWAAASCACYNRGGRAAHDGSRPLGTDRAAGSTARLESGADSSRGSNRRRRSHDIDPGHRRRGLGRRRDRCGPFWARCQPRVQPCFNRFRLMDRHK